LKSGYIEVIEMIPPTLNTELGGKGLLNGQPRASDFINAVFLQMQEGKTELSFGFIEIMTKATPVIINATFNKMNP
jgi:uncharacterized oxidoreductase